MSHEHINIILPTITEVLKKFFDFVPPVRASGNRVDPVKNLAFGDKIRHATHKFLLS